MKRDNQTSVSEFILLGLPILPEEQGMFYALFLAMYLTTVLWGTCSLSCLSG
jgi:olfactory receptor